MTETVAAHTTRMIFMGEAPLADGLRLIGFETWADPTLEQVELQVHMLIQQREKAFLVIDQRLADADLPAIRQVRQEGGHIVIATLPPLNQPEAFHLLLDERLKRLFPGSVAK